MAPPLLPPKGRSPLTDHVFVAGWDGEKTPARLLVNGDSMAAPMELAFGAKHRLRLVNIGASLSPRFALRRDSSLVTWRSIAKDGADLPATQATARPAIQQVSVGETYDFEFEPLERGGYVLSLRLGQATKGWQQRIEVR